MLINPNSNRLSRNSSTISQNNPDIMEYLISKLDNRLKQVIKHKQFISNINSFEVFFNQKRQVINLLSSLEDDIKQASYAIKALLNENKSLCIDLAKSEEEKQNSMNELIRNNVYLMSENENLKLQLNNMYPVDDSSFNNENNCQDINDLCKSSSNNNENNEQPPDVQNIITNIKSNKNKLKNVIQQHFNNTNNEQLNDEYNEEPNLVIQQPQQMMLLSNDDKNKLIIKIMNSPECIKALNEQIGNDYLERILNDTYNEEMLYQMNDIIYKTCDCPNKKYSNSNNANKAASCYNKAAIPKRIQNIINANKKSKSKGTNALQIKPKKKNFRSLSTSHSHLFTKQGSPVNFEKALRDYPSTPNSNQKKKFVHYTNPYGTYFDNKILNENKTRISLDTNTSYQNRSMYYPKSAKNMLSGTLGSE